MSEMRYAPQWTRRGWVLSLAIVFTGLAVFAARPGSAGPKTDITGTVSKTEPPMKQDGTPAHPYANASQCPSSTDLIIWPNGRAVPSIPPGISVCFVGNQSFKDDAPSLQVRQR